MAGEGSKVTQFKPGQSGNPSGSPKGFNRIDIIYKRLLPLPYDAWPNRETASAAEILAMDSILKGSTDAAFLKEILNRNDGPVREQVDVTSGGEPIECLTHDERMARLTALSDAARARRDGQASSS